MLRSRLGLLGLTFALAYTTIGCDTPAPPPTVNPNPPAPTADSKDKAEKKPEITTLPPIKN